MSLATTTTLQSIGRNEQGSIGMMFAIMMSSLILLIGCAVDIGRALHSSTKLASALDTAALAAAKLLKDKTKTDADLLAIAQKFFDINMVGNAGNYTKIDSFTLDIDRPNATVKAIVVAWIPTTFSRIAGFQKIDLPKTAVVSYDTKDIEVGLQLDVTGSMGAVDSTGTRKIDSLKSAVNDLLDVLLPDSGQPNKVRIGLAPFAGGVNAGTYAAAVSNGNAANGCVYERLRAANDTTDLAPIGLDAYKAKVDLVGPIQDCPSNAKVIALTDDKAALKANVAAYTTSTSTAGHLGTAWAWNLVSPDWSSIWPNASRPADYTDKKTVKYVILMTDGIYNTFNGQNTAGNTILSQNTAKALCDQIRLGKKIKIYAIGFIMPGEPAAAADTLKYCAGDAANFFKAEDGNQLRFAFRAIAQDISRLHLTQ